MEVRHHREGYRNSMVFNLTAQGAPYSLSGASEVRLVLDPVTLEGTQTIFSTLDAPTPNLFITDIPGGELRLVVSGTDLLAADRSYRGLFEVTDSEGDLIDFPHHGRFEIGVIS